MKFPGIFQEVKKRGHSVGNHTYNHLRGHKTSVREYIRLVSEHRDRLRLLLFQAQGSVLENFRSEYTDLMTRTISVFFQGMKQKYPHINIAITNFFIHLNIFFH